MDRKWARRLAAYMLAGFLLCSNPALTALADEAVAAEPTPTPSPDPVDDGEEGASGNHKTGRARYATKKIHLYAGRDTGSKVLKTIPEGAEVYEIAYRGAWSKVRYGGKTGYVRKKYLTGEAPASDGGADRLYDTDGSLRGMNKSDDTVIRRRRVRDWSDRIVLGEGGMPIPLLFQYDFPEPVCRIGGKVRSVRTSGCGATSVSMVAAYLTGNMTQNPYTVFCTAYDEKLYRGSGLDHEALAELALMLGVHGRWTNLTGAELEETLRAGTPIIAHMGDGLFTEGGHYIVLRGVTEDGQILVNDPASAQNSKMAYPKALFMEQSKSSAPYMICRRATDEEAQSVTIKASKIKKAKADKKKDSASSSDPESPETPPETSPDAPNLPTVFFETFTQKEKKS